MNASSEIAAKTMLNSASGWYGSLSHFDLIDSAWFQAIWKSLPALQYMKAGPSLNDEVAMAQLSFASIGTRMRCGKGVTICQTRVWAIPAGLNLTGMRCQSKNVP